MKLLFDENLSPRLIGVLESEYPNSRHVEALGLRGAADFTVWDAARDGGFVIVSKDNDFRQLSFLHGHPPKVVWLSIGNSPTEVIAALLQRHQSELQAFLEDPEVALYVLEPGGA